MNVELKFKPGIRTSMNSSSSIRDNFGKKQAGVTQTRNSTASSAVANLSQMSLVSGNWNSKSGSILNTGVTSNTRFSASVRNSSSNTKKIDPNYVSAGRSQAYVRDKYSQMQNFGFTRAENMTGYSGRGLQRLHDAAYGTGAYSEISGLNQMHAAQRSNGTDIITTVTTAAQVGKSVFDLGKNIWDTFSSKESKVSSGGGSVSDTASENVKGMKGAKDSVALNSAINTSKTDLQTTETSITTMKAQLSKANSDKAGLETAYNGAQTTFNNLDTQVKAQQEIVNQNTAALPAAQTSYESARAAYEAAPAEPAAAKTKFKDAMDAAKSKLDDINGKIDEANKQLDTLQPQLTEAKGKMDEAKQALDSNQKIIDETPAKIKDAESTVSEYNKEIPKQEKRLGELQKNEDKEFAKLAEKQEDKISAKDKTKRSDLAKAIASRSSEDDNTFEEIGGKTFAKITGSDGKSRYMVDGAIKTEAEFNAEMKQAKEPQILAEDLTAAERGDGMAEVNFA